MATIDDVYALLQKIADAMGVNEGTGEGYGDSNVDGYADGYGSYGEGTNFSLYKEVLKIQEYLQLNLDAPISSREATLKEPGRGPYFVARFVKDDTTAHSPIYNSLVEAAFSGTADIIRSTRTNQSGKFVLFFDTQDPVDITITSDVCQGTKLYGVIPQSEV